ncbi:bifunctional RNase H/acid phosphatase [Nonomuraea cavernae]|uniref:Bifunctional RNase H/acid phosphatase n=1 Tax=Nonomuraea cavernae TaxID=2045107 RepID=A0A917YZF6_9ACTN|nr:bifunctional RNase H/acid phosphatase [Nonomuraea cavernae]MCA2187634.1 bifunctional RNase H/acid phosphatase [Nonomuraea cavernae]GGO70968.1 bifunctional RNase H/acid phosphatase [Nonomuraea cavernae]
MTSYVIEADGGSRGNPGPAGYGAVVKDATGGQVLAEAAEAIGVTTNNVAEYRGLIAGLRAVLDVGGEGASVAVRMDSKLVVEQMAGRWKIKNEGLRPLALEAGQLARRLRVTEWTWIPRHLNSHADRLANEAMDAAAKGLHWKAGGSTDSATPPALVEQTDLLDVAGVSEVSAPAASVATTQQRAKATVTAKGTGWAPPARVATSLLLLRHGETPLSVERRFSGLGDAELTPNGLAQASAAAARLSREPYEIDVIVSSPLRRAVQTAEAVAHRTGLPVLVDEELREADFGAWEGHTFTEVQRRWPGELAAWFADPDAAPPDGESFGVVARRVQRAGERLLDQYEGRTILAVSHVTPIKMLLRFALMAPPEALYRMHLDLACLSLIEHYSDGQSVVKSFNDTSHLH